MGNKIKALSVAVVSLLLSLCFFACSSATVSLDKKSATMEIGESITVTATCSEEGDVTWTSDNEAVATVDGGVITAVGAGTAKVTATMGEASASVTITVRAAKKYTVSLDGEVQTVEAGSLVSKPADPVKAADAQYTYTFSGWYVKGTDTAWDFQTAVTGSVALESRYTKTVNTYAVKIGDAEEKTLPYGAYLTKPANPVKEADAENTYAFDGWYVAGTNTEWNFMTDTVSGELTLEAKFTANVRTYTVVIGGKTAYAKYGFTLTEPEAPVKAADAQYTYVFDAWVIAGTDTEWNFDNDTVSGDLTLEAKFEKSERTYSIVIDPANGDNTTTVSAKYGDKLTAPATPVKEATAAKQYVFDGWFIAGTNVKWDFSTALDGEIALVARYVETVRTYTVTLIDGDDVDYVTVNYGASAVLPELTKEDDKNVYIFGGWYDEGEKFVPGVTAVTEDVTLTAKWTPQPKYYTVGFYTEAGALLNEVNVKAGDNVAEAGNVPVKNQTVSTVYTFDKWVKADGSAYDFGAEVVENVKLFATYTESVRKYVVTLMDGEEVFGSVEIAYDTAFTYDDNAAIPEYDTVGMYFVAWGEQGATSAYTGKITGDKTLYAITDIDPVTYTVTFVVAGEEKTFENVSRNEAVSYGEIVLPDTSNVLATKNVFLGWALDGSTEVIYEKDDVIRCPQGGIKLVAIYEEVDIIYNIGITLKTDAYTIVDENGVAVTADALSAKYGQVFKFKVVNNSEETFGTVTVKNGAATMAATDGVYSFTVISNHLVTVDGLGVRTYDVTGSVTLETMQSPVAWAKTTNRLEDVVLMLTKNGEAEYLDIIDGYGNYELRDLLAANYRIDFVFYNEITDEWQTIGNGYEFALNAALDTDDDGYTLTELGNQNVGVRPYYFTDKNWAVKDGKFTIVTPTGTFEDNEELTLSGFMPGNKDFAITTSISQDVVRKSQHADGDQEMSPGMGLRFASYIGGKEYYANIQIVAEGDLRIYYSYDNGGEIAHTQAYAHNLVCSSGGFMGRSGWPDCYRNATLTYVRNGNLMHLFLTADGIGTNYNLLAVELYDLHIATLDIAAGKVYCKEEMTGKSWAPTGTGKYTVLDIPSLSKIFSNVENVRISFGTSKWEYLDFYGWNYTYNADVIDSYVVEGTYRNNAVCSGNVTVGGDAIAGTTLSFISASNRVETTVTADDKGAFSVNLPAGEYEVMVENGVAVTKIFKVNHNGAGALNFDVPYGFYGSYNNGTTTVTTDGTELIAVQTDPYSKGYENAVIRLKNYNRTIVWNQPIAAKSVWGYTLNLPATVGSYGDPAKGEMYNHDIWIKDEIGGTGSTYGLNTASAGVANGAKDQVNQFQAQHPNKSTWNQQLHNREVYSFDFMFVREGAKISRYMRLGDNEEWGYMGYHNTSISATADVYFKAFPSGRNGAGGNLYYVYTNMFYYEGDLATPAFITAEDNDNVTVTVDKSEAAIREMVTVTATAADGYAVNAFVVNGKTIPVTVGTSTYQFASFGFGETYEVTATAVKTTKFKTLSGNVTFERESYNKYYNTNSGTVTATAADGTVYTGSIVDGKYSVKVPAGKYEVTVSTNEQKTTFEVTVNANTTKDAVLDTNAAGFYKAITGNGLIYNEDDGSLTGKFAGNTNESAANGVTFTPNKQVVEFGFRLNGNLSGTAYPQFGMFLKEVNANRGGKVVTTHGAGDQVAFQTSDDYRARLSVDDNPWTEWKGGFFPGQEDSGLDAAGTWYADSYTNIEYKFRVDGHKISMWIRGTNKWWQNGQYNTKNLTDWTLCMFEYNIYDRYNAMKNEWSFGWSQADKDSGKATKYGQYIDTIYRVDQPCYFGVTTRQDGTEHNSAMANYADLWFEIYDKTDAEIGDVVTKSNLALWDNAHDDPMGGEVWYKGAQLTQDFILKGKLEVGASGDNPHVTWGDWGSNRFLLWDAGTDGTWNLTPGTAVVNSAPASCIYTKKDGKIATDWTMVGSAGNWYLYFGDELKCVLAERNVAVRLMAERTTARFYDLSALTLAADGEAYTKELAKYADDIAAYDPDRSLDFWPEAGKTAADVTKVAGDNSNVAVKSAGSTLTKDFIISGKLTLTGYVGANPHIYWGDNFGNRFLLWYNGDITGGCKMVYCYAHDKAASNYNIEYTGGTYTTDWIFVSYNDDYYLFVGNKLVSVMVNNATLDFFRLGYSDVSVSFTDLKLSVKGPHASFATDIAKYQPAIDKYSNMATGRYIDNVLTID